MGWREGLEKGRGKKEGDDAGGGATKKEGSVKGLKEEKRQGKKMGRWHSRN